MSVMQTWSEYVRSVVGEKSTHLDIAMQARPGTAGIARLSMYSKRFYGVQGGRQVNP